MPTNLIMFNRIREKANKLNNLIVGIGMVLLVLCAIIIPCILPTGIIALIAGIGLFGLLIFYLWFFNIE